MALAPGRVTSRRAPPSKSMEFAMFRRSLIALWIFCVVAAPFALAQGKKGGEDTNTRSVQGSVSNAAGEAINGAIVQLKNTKSLQIRSFITKDQGTYYFHGLSPDIDYELKAEYQGASSPSKTLSSFDNRKKAVINLKVSK